MDPTNGYRGLRRRSCSMGLLERTATILPRHLQISSRYRIRIVRLDITKLDRKSTRLNSSHQIISYAVFCLKKKKQSHRRAGREIVDVPRLSCKLRTHT